MVDKLDYKVVFGENDLSEYVVNRLNVNPTASDNVPIGNITISNSNPFNISYGMDVYFYLNYTSDVLFFGGYVDGIKSDERAGTTLISLKGFKGKTFGTEYSGKFRNDLANANARDLVIAIIQEKFPDWTYDTDSFPITDVEFLTKAYQDVKTSVIFDEIALRLNRQWWLDNNKKFFMRSRIYEDVSTVIDKDNITGSILDDIDDSRFGNVIKVLGSRFNVDHKEEFTPTGSPDEFELNNFPLNSTQVEYTDGTPISVSLEGVENYDDSSVYDAYFKPDIKKLKFNVNTSTINGDILIRYQTTSRVREELPVASSIESLNYEKSLTIDNENITTQEDAYEIAQRYADANSLPINIYTIPVFIKSNDYLTDLIPGKRAEVITDKFSGFYNIVEVNLSWNTRSGFVYAIRLNDVPLGAENRLNNLLFRINQRNEKELLSGEGVVKTLYWSGNMYIVIDNVSIESTDADDNTFILQDENITPAPDDRSLLSDSPTLPSTDPAAIMRDEFTTSKDIIYIDNLDLTFIERFLDDFFINDSSDGTRTKGLYALFSLNDEIISKLVFTGTTSYSQVEINIDSSHTNYILKVSINGTAWQTISPDVLTDLTLAGTNIYYKIINDSGTVLNLYDVQVKVK